MKNLNSNNRLKVLSRSVACLRAVCAVKKIFAVVKGRQLALAAIVAAVASVSVAAVLTPSSGILSATVLARAGFADRVDMVFKIRPNAVQRVRGDDDDDDDRRRGDDREIIRVRDAEETVMQQIIIGPGGQTGWHSHPGPVVVLVKSGALTFYSGEDGTCTSRTYSAGQAFIDSGQGHVHVARNEGSENLELWATYFDVPPGGAFRIDAPNPGNCGF
jgi:quercetin dioxygenase-like cupin family protein